MPQKHQPDHPYLRHVPLTRVYLFTGIQILCLVFLWVIKSIKEIAILFPVMVSIAKLISFSLLYSVHIKDQNVQNVHRNNTMQHKQYMLTTHKTIK